MAVRLETADDRLRESCDRLTLLADQSLDRMATGLLQGSRKHAEIQNSRFDNQSSRFAELSRRILEQSALRLTQAEASTKARLPAQLAAAEEELERNRAGLQAGTRKLQELMVARHQGQALKVRNSVFRAVERPATRVSTSAATLVVRTESCLTSRNQALGWQRKHLSAAKRLLGAHAEALTQIASRLTVDSFSRVLKRQRAVLEEKARLLDALDPVRLLDRGYSVTRDSSGRLVMSVADVRVGGALKTQLRDGTLVSVVQTAERPSND